MSWKPEVQTVGSKAWTGNGIAFATQAEAEQWAFDLMMRWTAVEDYRAVESDEPVNRKVVDNKVEEVK